MLAAMPRLVRIALVTTITFFGGVIAALGVRFWFATHRTVQTLLDPPSISSDLDAVPFDHLNPWFDKAFLLHRFAAVVTLVIGLCILGWAARLMLRKERNLAT